MRVPKPRPAKPKRKSFARVSKRDASRRLACLGFSRHDDPDTQEAALNIVEKFLAYVRRRACIVTGKRSGESIPHPTMEGYLQPIRVEAAHLECRGSFAPDFGNVVPLSAHLHREQQNDPSFWLDNGIDEYAAAKRITLAFLTEYPTERAWLAEHAMVEEIVKLCEAAE